MRHPKQFDDLQLEHSDLDDNWVAGEIELTEERPATALRTDPSHRKLMLVGVGACSLLTAIAVLLGSRGASQAQAADQPAVEPAPIEQPIQAPAIEPAPVEPAPEVSPSKRREKPTLAATSRAASGAAATAPSPIKKAPPAPAPAPAATPSQPTSPAAQPAAPSSTTPAGKPAPAVTPTLPAEQPSDDRPTAELPDVEAWDEADAAADQDEPAPAS